MSTEIAEGEAIQAIDVHGAFSLFWLIPTLLSLVRLCVDIPIFIRAFEQAPIIEVTGIAA